MMPRVDPTRLQVIGLGVAAALALVLGGVTLGQSQRIRALLAHMAILSSRLAAQERVLALLTSPTSRTAILQGSVQANVRFVYDPAAGYGALVVADLRAPEPGAVYQLWLVGEEEPRSAGVFRPIAGQTIAVSVDADFRRHQGVAISIEQGPRGSAAGPTSAPVLSGKI